MSNGHRFNTLARILICSFIAAPTIFASSPVGFFDAVSIVSPVIASVSVVDFVIHSSIPAFCVADNVGFFSKRLFILSIHSLNIVLAEFHASHIFVVSTAHSVHLFRLITSSAYVFALAIWTSSARYLAASQSAVHHSLSIFNVKLSTSSPLAKRFVYLPASVVTSPRSSVDFAIVAIFVSASCSCAVFCIMVSYLSNVVPKSPVTLNVLLLDNIECLFIISSRNSWPVSVIFSVHPNMIF
jgi:hypothetical protein